MPACCGCARPGSTGTPRPGRLLPRWLYCWFPAGRTRAAYPGHARVLLCSWSSQPWIMRTRAHIRTQMPQNVTGQSHSVGSRFPCPPPAPTPTVSKQALSTLGRPPLGRGSAVVTRPQSQVRRIICGPAPDGPCVRPRPPAASLRPRLSRGTVPAGGGRNSRNREPPAGAATPPPPAATRRKSLESMIYSL